MMQWVYSFGAFKGTKEESRNLLGSKGANLAEMSNLGLPVPPGFTITTEACNHYYANNYQAPTNLLEQVANGIKAIEQVIGSKFGDENNPLLVSIRSGARASMPGMMDTVLNLGLNDKTIEGLANATNNPRFAYDSYRRFIQMYSDVVLGIDHYAFEEVLDNKKFDVGAKLDTDLDVKALKDIVSQYKKIVEDKTGKPFPQDVNEQVRAAILAVFKSWMNNRAITYRKLHNIAESWGTAVTVQAMVFGNMCESSATGVLFTRDPSTGENVIYGEYLVNAQGEDVVAGIRTPQAITKLGKERTGSNKPSMEEAMPIVFNELITLCKKLEAHYRDMQDIEFTIQKGRLWLLQTRSGKRSINAAIKIAVDITKEGVISKEEAILRIDPYALDQLLHPTIDKSASYNVIEQGLPASPGAASGIVVFSADIAEQYAAAGKKVILVRMETSPEDIHGMHAAQGIITSRGGMTSHAAVVARGMGKPCVCGASGIVVDYSSYSFRKDNVTVKQGDVISINGSTGEIILGEVPTIHTQLSEDFLLFMDWVDNIRKLSVRTNAETPIDAAMAKKFGAEGIGLCRTEHMFFNEERILAVRQMILSEKIEDRKSALDTLLPMQKNDFVELFKIMDGLPVNIRLLDPPLHEFLPTKDSDIEQLAKLLNVQVSAVKHRVNQLHESNPMLGHRGCRLGITYPEIYEMQANAIFQAMMEVEQYINKPVIAEIMIPLVMNANELKILKNLIDGVASAIINKHGKKLRYTVGTMIELPRAAMTADQLAQHAAFFSFGTNDLTQTTLGISRDDSSTFIGIYKDMNIIDNDPFVKLDIDGVGELIKIAVAKGRRTNQNIKVGICGEHGGNPESILFCEQIGLDYVSCSPYRVPIARLSAAQATIKIRYGGLYNA
jgi:pyruvate,orthophosphate dikinase